MLQLFTAGTVVRRRRCGQVWCVDGKHRVTAWMTSDEIKAVLVNGWFRWYKSALLKDASAMVRCPSQTLLWLWYRLFSANLHTVVVLVSRTI